MTNQIQLRGHCQLCGNEQAVTRGYMAYHGYTVEHGFFSGKCGGSNYKPIEAERTQIDKVCADVLAQCFALDLRVADLKAGRVYPETYETTRAIFNKTTRKFEAVVLPFAVCDEYQQKCAIEQAIGKAERRAVQGRRFAEYLAQIADAFHGKALREVEPPKAPEAIMPGEQRISSYTSRMILKAFRIERGRVYWRSDDGTKGWTGTQSWRKLAKAEA